MEYIDLAEAVRRFPCTKKLQDYFKEKNIYVEVGKNKDEVLVFKKIKGNVELIDKVKLDCCSKDDSKISCEERDCRMEYFMRENARLIRSTQIETLRLPLEHLKKNHPEIYQDPDKLAEFAVNAIYGVIDFCQLKKEEIK